LAYFVLLATGLFDDLAWLARHLYAPSKNLREVDLREGDLNEA
jgi:hypothetical protein